MIDPTLAAVQDHSIPPTTLTALYDVFSHADGAVRDLEAVGISTNDIGVIGNHGHATSTNAETDAIIESMTQAGVTEAHAHVYAEGVRRGGALISVRTQPEKVALVRSVLDRHEPVDPDIRGAVYREAGWTADDAPAIDATGEHPPA